ncbi:hypothetical protein GGX14DRAFT_397293 [Mycena pura]|uniref:Uncharacterized protein n=1 Tax=Mycena pura TaxID=153505 RepID=A0AAD6YCP4_9AGAR|nr:hypothetical protein GGX14DRAFT_397293 [Mycena pura]
MHYCRHAFATGPASHKRNKLRSPAPTKTRAGTPHAWPCTAYRGARRTAGARRTGCPRPAPRARRTAARRTGDARARQRAHARGKQGLARGRSSATYPAPAHAQQPPRITTHTLAPACAPACAVRPPLRTRTTPQCAWAGARARWCRHQYAHHAARAPRMHALSHTADAHARTRRIAHGPTHAADSAWAHAHGGQRCHVRGGQGVHADSARTHATDSAPVATRGGREALRTTRRACARTRWGAWRTASPRTRRRMCPLDGAAPGAPTRAVTDVPIYGGQGAHARGEQSHGPTYGGQRSHARGRQGAHSDSARTHATNSAARARTHATNSAAHARGGREAQRTARGGGAWRTASPHARRRMCPRARRTYARRGGRGRQQATGRTQPTDSARPRVRAAPDPACARAPAYARPPRVRASPRVRARARACSRQPPRTRTCARLLSRHGYAHAHAPVPALALAPPAPPRAPCTRCACAAPAPALCLPTRTATDVPMYGTPTRVADGAADSADGRARAAPRLMGDASRSACRTYLLFTSCSR